MITIDLDQIKTVTETIRKSINDSSINKKFYCSKSDPTKTIKDLADAIKHGVNDFTQYRETSVKDQLKEQATKAINKDVLDVLRGFINACDGLEGIPTIDTKSKIDSKSDIEYKKEELRKSKTNSKISFNKADNEITKLIASTRYEKAFNELQTIIDNEGKPIRGIRSVFDKKILEFIEVNRK